MATNDCAEGASVGHVAGVAYSALRTAMGVRTDAVLLGTTLSPQRNGVRDGRKAEAGSDVRRDGSGLADRVGGANATSSSELLEGV